MHGCGALGGNQKIGLSNDGIITKIHMAVDAHGMPIRIIITEGTAADFTHDHGKLIVPIK